MQLSSSMGKNPTMGKNPSNFSEISLGNEEAGDRCVPKMKVGPTGNENKKEMKRKFWEMKNP